MHGIYLIRIEAWPFHTGNGADADQRAAGPRERLFVAQADGFEAACGKGRLLAAGMRTNPAVWQAPIVEVRYIRDRSEVEPAGAAVEEV